MNNDDTSSRARKLGHSFAARFPRLAVVLEWAGRVLKVSLLVGFAVFIGYGLLLIGTEIAKNPGRLLDSPAVTLVLGFLILAVEWLWSQPGYVWFGLFVLYGLFAIASQLGTLNAQVSRLIEEVRDLKAEQDQGDNEFEALDDEGL